MCLYTFINVYLYVHTCRPNCGSFTIYIYIYILYIKGLTGTSIFWRNLSWLLFCDWWPTKIHHGSWWSLKINICVCSPCDSNYVSSNLCSIALWWSKCGDQFILFWSLLIQTTNKTATLKELEKSTHFQWVNLGYLGKSTENGHVQ